MKYLKQTAWILLVLLISYLLYIMAGTDYMNPIDHSVKIPQGPIYKYTINAGSPANYPMLYAFNGNYFYDTQDKTILNFFPAGGSTGYWPYGSQATVISERNILPYGVQVRWFSVAENQFWEGRYIFDQKQLQKLMLRVVEDTTSRRVNAVARAFSFTVYVVPDGYAYIWLAGGGEMFLLGQFQAKKMQEEPDWEFFYRSSYTNSGQVEPRDEFIVQHMKDAQNYIKETYHGRAEFFSTEQPSDQPLTAAPWQGLMKTYYWYLSVDNRYFILRDARIAYVNGEIRYMYSGDDQLAKSKTVPSFMAFYFQDKQRNNIPERIDIRFDQDEIMQHFKELALTAPMDNPINLYMDIAPDLSDLHVYLIKDKHKIQLKKIKPRLTNLYNGGDNKNTPWPEQIKRWQELDHLNQKNDSKP